jgi:hypothetical protein
MLALAIPVSRRFFRRKSLESLFKENVPEQKQ